MTTYMLDTSICIKVIRGRSELARTTFNANAGAMCISTVVQFELLFGAAWSASPDKARRATLDLVQRLDVIAFDEPAAAHAADIRASLGKAGRQIGPYDLMIAGHARSRGSIVVTGNIAEFARVDGLRCEDWLAQDA